MLPGSGKILARLSGSWQTVQSVWAKSGGVWVEVWKNFAINVGFTGYVSYADPGAPAQTIFTLRTDGSCDGNGFAPVLNNWGTSIVAGVGAEWEVMATRLSGTTPSGSALNTYLALSSSRAWSVVDTTDNEITVRCDLKFTFRKAGTTTPTYDSGTVTLEATRGIGL